MDFCSVLCKNIPQRLCISFETEKRVQKNQTDNGDSRPTQPPQKDVTQPSNRGAEQISVICGPIVVVSIILLLFIGLKRKAIKKCTEQLRGRKRPEPEVAAGGSTGEMLDPTSGEASDNLKKPAENRSENIIYSEA
ncbi:hypothetical protein Q8A73_002888 [Channa argus]|nr:hypothetical protein Q8A73_002888 [Channa argus]